MRDVPSHLAYRYDLLKQEEKHWNNRKITFMLPTGHEFEPWNNRNSH